MRHVEERWDLLSVRARVAQVRRLDEHLRIELRADRIGERPKRDLIALAHPNVGRTSGGAEGRDDRLAVRSHARRLVRAGEVHDRRCRVRHAEDPVDRPGRVLVLEVEHPAAVRAPERVHLIERVLGQVAEARRGLAIPVHERDLAAPARVRGEGDGAAVR